MRFAVLIVLLRCSGVEDGAGGAGGADTVGGASAVGVLGVLGAVGAAGIDVDVRCRCKM